MHYYSDFSWLFQRFFITLYCWNKLCIQQTYFSESVSLILIEKSGKFRTVSRITQRSSLVLVCNIGTFCAYPILCRCGVLFIWYKVYQSLSIDKRRLHTFLFYNHNPNTIKESDSKMNFDLTMEKQSYIAPEIEIFEVAIEKGFANSQLEDYGKNTPIGW